MKLTLFILISFLLIPLSSYSYKLTQETDTLVINKKQIKAILLDHKELEYRRELNKSDASHILELQTKVILYKESEKAYVSLVDIHKKQNKRLKLLSLGLLILTGYLILK